MKQCLVFLYKIMTDFDHYSGVLLLFLRRVEKMIYHALC